jgi:hypothetical protein
MLVVFVPLVNIATSNLLSYLFLLVVPCRSLSFLDSGCIALSLFLTAFLSYLFLNTISHYIFSLKRCRPLTFVPPHVEEDKRGQRA